MSFKHVWFRNLSPLALVLCAFSCAHTPYPHVHLSATAPPPGASFVIRGNVTDAESGLPFSHAVVALADVRHENWGSLLLHSARLGTADRKGLIDLAVTWGVWEQYTLNPLRVDDPERVRSFTAIVDAAEARCRAGDPASIAVIIEPAWDEPVVLLFDASDLAASAQGDLVLDIGTVKLTLPSPPIGLSGLSVEEREAMLDAELPAEVEP